MSFHNEHTPGELIERIDGDVASLANFFSQFVIQILGNGILMLGILVILAREDLRLGGTMAAFGHGAHRLRQELPAEDASGPSHARRGRDLLERARRGRSGVVLRSSPMRLQDRCSGPRPITSR